MRHVFAIEYINLAGWRLSAKAEMDYKKIL